MVVKWCEECGRPRPLGLDYCVVCGGSIRDAIKEEVDAWLKGFPPHVDPPLSSDTITEIIIEDCFHLKRGRGLQVLYEYSEKTLARLIRAGYMVSDKEDHIIFMRKGVV